MAKSETTWQEKNRENTARKQREQTARDNEIGSLPEIENPQRRERAEKDLGQWTAIYCACRHPLPDSKNHARMCDIFQDAIESRDSWLCVLGPRGEAKTLKISEAIAWAMVSGRKKFVSTFSSSSATMGTLSEYFSALFMYSPTLQADYPEICHPLAKRGLYRQRKLTFQGKDIELEWGHHRNGRLSYRLPQIPGFPSAGARMLMSSIGSKIRGQGGAILEGNIRPDLAFLDDIQDEEMAHSEKQLETKWEVMVKAIAGLSGDYPMPIINSGTPFHDRCFMARTYKDRRFKNALFRSIYAFPERMDLWYEYQKLWEETRDEWELKLGLLQADKADEAAWKAATEFYQRNRTAMDAGADISWPARYEKKYSGASAIENIMREYLIILGPETFEREKNCEMRPRLEEDVPKLTEEIFLSKVDVSLDRYVSPKEAVKICYAIDIHENVLYYEGIAFEQGFNCHVIDYGTFPEQPQATWRQATVSASLAREFPGLGVEGTIRAGLDELVQKIMSRKYFREDGTEIYVEKILLDNNKEWHKTIESFNEENPWREKTLCYKGSWYNEGTITMRKGEKGGLEWKWSGRGKKNIIAFRDFWKTYNLNRWLTARGDKASKTIFKGGLNRHRKFYAEITAQDYRRKETRSGRSMLRWDAENCTNDDHWLDTDFMCILAGSIADIKQEVEGKPRKSVSLGTFSGFQSLGSLQSQGKLF
ncbi:MAG: phage terminase large subunit family protein [Planctomycetia bacterium]|nr:phage terminase large subunit family protein [Planctomycetia bacterium]